MPETASTLQKTVRTRLHVGAFEIDLATRELWRDGEPVQVRRLVFDLVAYLIQRRPAAVSHDELLREVWQRGNASPSTIARTVMEARRAIGDDTDRPRYIVNLHGVGYRFAAELGDESQPEAALPATAATLSPSDQVARLIEEARQMHEQGSGIARSREKARAALALALEHGVTLGQARALCWLAWLALWSDDVEGAARAISHGLHLAEQADHAMVRAELQVANGFLRIIIGDLDRAMQQLTAAHSVLLNGGLAIDRYRCENLLCGAERHLGMIDQAWRWNEMARKTAQAAGLHKHRIGAENNALTLHLEAGDEHERRGDIEAARRSWQTALAACDALLPTVDAAQEPWLHCGIVGNRAVLLGRLGQFSEAWHLLHQVQRLMAEIGQDKSSAAEERRMNWQLECCRLLAREGRPQEALDRLQGLLDAPPGQVPRHWVPRLAELGSEVAESRGRLDLALAWCRRRLAEQQALDMQRARRLAQVLHIDSMQDMLRRELDEARRDLQHLQRQHADLLRQCASAQAEG